MLSKLPKHESEIPRKGAVDFAANLRKLVGYQQQLIDQLNSNVDAYNKLAKEVGKVEVKNYDDQINSLVSSIRKINGNLSNLQNYDDSALVKRIKSLELSPKVDIEEIKKASSEKVVVKEYDDTKIKAMIETYSKRCDSDMKTYFQLFESEIKKRDEAIKELSESISSIREPEPSECKCNFYSEEISKIKEEIKKIHNKPEIDLSGVESKMESKASKSDLDSISKEINNSMSELLKKFESINYSNQIENINRKINEISLSIEGKSPRSDIELMKSNFESIKTSINEKASTSRLSEISKDIKSLKSMLDSKPSKAKFESLSKKLSEVIDKLNEPKQEAPTKQEFENLTHQISELQSVIMGETE